MSNDTENNSQEQAAATQLIAGVQQYFIPGNVTVTVAGVVITPTAMTAALQSRVSTINASITAKAALSNAVAAEATTKATTKAIVSAIKQLALIMYANQPEVLTVFGIAPRKVPTPATSAELAERAAKAKATRIARNTMGPKQKAKVKGVVPVPIASAAVTVSGAPSTGATGTGSKQ